MQVTIEYPDEVVNRVADTLGLSEDQAEAQLVSFVTNVSDPEGEDFQALLRGEFF
jgi:hypothetical protein